MKQLLDRKKARIMASGVAFSFMVIHIIMLVIFIRCGVTPMVYFNIGSVLFYIAMQGVIYKEWFRFFALGTYLEVVAHMSAAVICTGWSHGFEVTLIGMSILLHYTEYAGRFLKLRYIPATPVCLVGMFAYLGTCIVNHFYSAPYPLSPDVSFSMRVFWGAIVFVITIFFLYTFVQLTSGSDEMLTREAGHDKLTGLPNRYFMSDHLNRLKDEEGLERCWAAMLDIDDFKNINDTHGHNCGDFVLREIAAVLQGSHIDMTICRWGGEEFLMQGRVENTLDQCYEALDFLRRRISEYRFLYKGMELRLTVTIGLAEWQPDTDISSWIDAADRRMYQGKRSGKNRVVV